MCPRLHAKTVQLATAATLAFPFDYFESKSVKAYLPSLGIQIRDKVRNRLEITGLQNARVVITTGEWLPDLHGRLADFK